MGHPTSSSPKALPRIVKKNLPSGKELTIRGMERDDLPELGKIYADVYTKQDVGETWTPDTAREMLEDLDDKSPALSLVGEIEGEIVGAILGDVKKWQGKRTLEVKEIFVKHALQKQEIGSELLKEESKKASVWYGAEEIELVTFSETGHAKDWYKKLGLKDVEGLKIMSGDLREISANLQGSEHKG